MATPTYTLIDSATLGSSAASVTFSSLDTVATAYTDLVVVVAAKNSNYAGLSLTINGQSTNYSQVYMRNSPGSNTLQSGSSGTSPYLNSYGDAYGDYALWEIQIFNFSDTDKHKSAIGRFGTTTTAISTTNACAYMWASTAAITALSISAQIGSGQTMSAGSTFYLYGIEA